MSTNRDKFEPSDAQSYSDDSPKINPWTEDRLGFRQFAERLAKAISHLHAPHGYVIGLHGAWGSGKSTAPNFVEAYLKKYNDEATVPLMLVVNFRPWIVSGHQDLVSAFFKILTETLDPDRAKRRGFWRKSVELFRRTSGSLGTTVATIGAAIEPTGVVTSAASKFTAASFDKLLEYWLSEPSLQSAHQKLVVELEKKNQKILVIIDDIDRLQREEIRATMQLVKSVGQLPNVIYLLAYDRQVVWTALDDFPQFGSSRPSFAEKIVQQEVDLPVPSSGSLLDMFDGEVRFLLKAIEGDGIRWHHLLLHGVRRWLRQPRDVLRLTNALKFCGPALMDEVDPQDLLAMEGLRLFDRVVFDWIRLNRDFLFSEGAFQVPTDEQRAAHGRRFREHIPADSRDDILKIVSDLFPQVAKHLTGDQRYFGEAYSQTVSRRGVGTNLGYEAYFSLYPSPDGIPKPVIDELASRLNDEEWLSSTLQSYLDKSDRRGGPLIAELLREISMRLHARNRLQPTEALLKALIRCGDGILPIDRSSSSLGFLPRASWSNLVSEMLKTWGLERAGRAMLDALSVSNSPAVWAELYVARGRELGVLPDSGPNVERLITDADFAEFGARLLALIQTAAADGTLANAPYYFHVIRAWRHLDDVDAVRTWISHGVDTDPVFLSKLSMGLLAYSIESAGSRRYFMNSRPEAELYDLAQLQAAARRYLEQRALDGEAADRWKALVIAQENPLL